jgi:phosphatidylethanolamine/phosphatidyl-N-methylethanolamine N-methyltransferase
VEVVGLDLSAGMLVKAAEKIRKHNLTHCSLLQADAMLPPLADHSFDHTLITHTVSVVSDPARLMAWAKRITRPGGRIVLLNHFRSTHPVVERVEAAIDVVSAGVGWTKVLKLDDAMRGLDLNVDYQFKAGGPMDFWRIIVLSNRPPQDRWSETDADAAPSSARWAVDSAN